MIQIVFFEFSRDGTKPADTEDKMTTPAARVARPTIVAIVTPPAPTTFAGPHPMTTAWLRRHLGVVLAVKCVLLAALWWCFFREARPVITTEDAASHLLSTQQERPE